MVADTILSIFSARQHPRCPRLLVIILFYLSFFGLSSCVYRFTNLAMSPPAGITSIAVEAVYDTSEEVLPHEYLWNAVQQALAGNGRIHLTSQSAADAILRMHLRKADVLPNGTVARDPVAKDPKITSLATVQDPDAFRRLTRAGAWTLEEALGVAVDVEVYRIENQKLIFKSTYTDATTFKSQRSRDMAQMNTQYLLYEESLGASFELLAKRIADKIVADLLISS